MSNIDRVDAALNEHRALYLGALYEAERHMAEINRLLELRTKVQNGRKLAVT